MLRIALAKIALVTLVIVPVAPLSAQLAKNEKCSLMGMVMKWDAAKQEWVSTPTLCKKVDDAANATARANGDDRPNRLKRCVVNIYDPSNGYWRETTRLCR